MSRIATSDGSGVLGAMMLCMDDRRYEQELGLALLRRPVVLIRDESSHGRVEVRALTAQCLDDSGELHGRLMKRLRDGYLELDARRLVDGLEDRGVHVAAG